MTELAGLLRDVGAVGLDIRDTRDAISRTGPPGIVRVGVHRGGPLPEAGHDGFDILLTSAAAPPFPWVAVPDLDAAIAQLTDITNAQPLAAAALVQVLRITPSLDFASALLVESFAYSTLLASDGFRSWLTSRAPPRARADAGSRVRLEWSGGALMIVLNRPRGRNAFDAAMRDALCEALEFASQEPDGLPVILRGEGAVFSIGGDLAEFGQAADPIAAHAIRTLRSPARLLHDIAGRVTAQLHGPCVGAGIELPAAAHRIVAHPGTSFRLPELAMGLIPGAGGTVTIPRRIGRHRACWLAMSGQRIDAGLALDWRLIDAVEG